jgi:CheY-like chemotaxis protein
MLASGHCAASFPSRLAPHGQLALESRPDPAVSVLFEDAVHQMHSRTILLAEPNARLRSDWRAGLEGMGFYVRESADGASALRAALHSEVALIITELYLPSGSDRCLVRATRREAALKRIKILVVSDHASNEDRAWALAEGADAYLVKPIRLGRMLQISASLATTRSQSRGEMRAPRAATIAPRGTS